MERKALFLFFIFLLSFSPFVANTSLETADEMLLETGLTPEQYLNYSIELINKGYLEQSIKTCEKVLETNPNDQRALSIISTAYVRQNKWEEAITYGEKAIQIDPNYSQAYESLYYAYSGLEEWEKAEAASLSMYKIDPKNQVANNNLYTAQQKLKTIASSDILIKIFFFVLVLLFILLHHKKISGKQNNFKSISILEVTLLSTATLCLIYNAFFYFAPYIRSLNTSFPSGEFTITTKYYAFEHDGIEGYTLFALTILSVFSAFLFSLLLKKLKSNVGYNLVIAVSIVLSYILLNDIGFFPAWAEPSILLSESFYAIMITGVVAALLFFVNKFSKKLVIIPLIIILAFVCFIATEPISIVDYSFILAPALRLNYGNKLSDIYFQYDLFLSLIAYLWLKIKADFNSLQVVGQISYFLFFIGIYFFSRAFWKNKSNSIFFLVFLLIVHYYANMMDPVSLFQITPLRLDLWIIPLILIHWKSPYHWSLGLTQGLLFLLHKNFGIIYLICYLQLLFILFIVDTVEKRNEETLSHHIIGTLKKHLQLSWKNISIIIGFIGLSAFLFNGLTAESAMLYQKIGIGMIPISKISFYWYVPIVLGLLTVLLVRLKNQLSEKYFFSGIFIVLLAIGNSMYFFGRSHEHNIINISAILSLALFTFFDIASFNKELVISSKNSTAKKKADTKTSLSFPLPVRIKHIVINLSPIIALVFAAYYYGARINKKTELQLTNLKKKQFIYPLPDKPNDIATLKRLTNNSEKVFFLDFKRDFIHYYYGGYQPVGYFNPTSAYIFNKDLVLFVQQLLEQHYYIVTTDIRMVQDLLPMIKYNNIKGEAGFTIISNENVDPILPTTSNSNFHITMKNPVSIWGIDCKPLKPDSVFSLECIVKPTTNEIPGATIISNLGQNFGNSGFVLQRDNNNSGNYIFVFGDGRQWISSPPFHLEESKWNYLAISLSGKSLTVYNNGAKLAEVNTSSVLKNRKSFPIIGNMPNRDKTFNGLIRELKISPYLPEEQTISERWLSVQQKTEKL